MIDIANDIHSLREFRRRNTSESLARSTGHPLALTINGRAELVVQDECSYQKLPDRVEELETIAGIQRGLAAVDAGQVTPLRQFEQELRTERGLSSRTR